MDKKNPPKFKSIYVINASSAIHRKYFQMFEQSKFLIEKQKQGSEYLSTFPTLLCDIFCCLYLSYPKAKKLEEIHPKYLVNMTIIEGLLISDAFKRIRDKTCFSDIASIWATELFADKLLQTLTKQKWKRKFKKFDDKYGEEEEKKEENVNMGEPKKKTF